MSRHVAIIGTGHVGADVACSIVTQNFADHISLFDKNTAKAASEALELQDMASLVGSRVQIDANDEQQLASVNVVVVAVGPAKTQTVDRLNELVETSKAAGMWAPKLRDAGFDGVLIDITNPCDVVTWHMADLLDLPKGQVFGSGTSLDSARMRRVVGSLLNVDPVSVEGYTMGEHGESQFVAWSSVRVGGVPFTDWPQAEGANLDELENHVRRGGWDVLEGKGWTSFGIAAAAAKLVDAVFSDAQRVFAVSTFNEKLGVFHGQPAIIGAKGVVKALPIELNADEQQRLERSAEVIRKAKASIQA